MNMDLGSTIIIDLLPNVNGFLQRSSDNGTLSEEKNNTTRISK